MQDENADFGVDTVQQEFFIDQLASSTPHHVHRRRVEERDNGVSSSVFSSC